MAFFCRVGGGGKPAVQLLLLDVRYNRSPIGVWKET
jgi:hypothetical protein